MAKFFRKLVRDRIPEIIESKGEKPVTKTLTQDEYTHALGMKLIEEAHEILKAANPDEIALEIADLLEVLDAIRVNNNLSEEQVVKLKEERKRDRGGFEKRVFLDWVE